MHLSPEGLEEINFISEICCMLVSFTLEFYSSNVVNIYSFCILLIFFGGLILAMLVHPLLANLH